MDLLARQEAILARLKLYPQLEKNEVEALVEEVVRLTDDAYTRTAQQYSDKHAEITPQGKEGLTRLYEIVRQYFPDGTLQVLDVGAGPGQDLAFLQQLGDVKGLGLEKSAAFIAIKHPGVAFIQADMRDLPVADESQHLVIHHAVIHHLPYLPGSGIDAEKAIAEVVRVLKKGGIFKLAMKYGPDMWFDEVGRFFQHFNEESVAKLLAPFPLKVLKQGVISRYTTNTAWRDWLHVTLQKQ